MDYEKLYKEALERATKAKNNASLSNGTLRVLGIIFPELKEMDELTWLTKYIEEEAYYLSIDIRDEGDRRKLKNLKRSLAWLLEKQKELKTELVDEDEIYWLAWVIGRLPDTEQANEAEAVLKELLGKLEKIKARRQQ